jgi:CDP-glycerol glycerophosphotransferase (TagB/SpsB family)
MNSTGESRRYLFFVTQNYSFEILRPLEREILRRGDEVAWFISPPADPGLLNRGERRFERVAQARGYQPEAVFAPGNVVPHFFPGIKVQVFHGLEWKKKGHLSVRGMFHLYCTHGPVATDWFLAEARRDPHFRVVETGWTKMDAIVAAEAQPRPENGRPLLLYAPTFSPSLTSAPTLLDSIRELARSGKWDIWVKFHPKMDRETVAGYTAAQSRHLRVVDGPLGPFLQAADLLLSDTSSAIYEFLLLDKPVVTFGNSVPDDASVDIRDASELESALRGAVSADPERDARRRAYIQKVHPFSDGRSSARVMDAVEAMLRGDLRCERPLPRNRFRKLRMRWEMKYFGPAQD